MKIILTIDYSPWSAYSGGAQVSTHNIATVMAQRGHEVTVVYSKPPWEKINVPDDLKYRIEWADLFSLRSKRRTSLRALTPFSVKREIDRILSQSKPGEQVIVHSNGEEGGMVHLLKKKHHFGFISTPRHPHYPGKFFHLEKMSLVEKILFGAREGKYLMQASAILHADIVAPPSYWAGQILLKAFKDIELKLRHVHNGIPAEYLNYKRSENASNGPLVFFGRFSRTKGVDTLMDALHLIDDKNLPPVHLIGRGDLEGDIRKKISSYNLTDKVKLLPWMTQSQLGTHLTDAGMTVLPSREENFSLAVLCSMCVGVPTICTDVGGTSEVVKDGENGILITPDDPQKLANAIERLLKNKDEANKIGANAARLVRQNFTWDAAAEKFEKLYREALNKNQSVDN